MIARTKDEMLQNILDRLQSQIGITETSPGSIARMFSEIMVEEFQPFYEELDLVETMSRVSTAKGAYLDLLGELVNCTRDTVETDDNYRARIVNQVSVLQSANLLALRFKALSVAGVADVQFKRYTRGTGSFTCYVTPQEYPVNQSVLANVENELDAAAAYGMGIEVKISEYLPVDMNINLIFKSKTTSLEREHVRNKVISNLDAYMKQLNMGSPIIINEVTQRVMETSDSILDMNIKEIRVNDRQYIIKNIEPSIEQQYFLRKISVI